MNHLFIFTPGIWRGYGTITLSYSPEIINFYIQWTIQEEENGLIKAEQKIERAGIKEALINIFLFKKNNENSFTTDITSETFGNIKAKGLTSDETIHWEISQNTPFEDTIGFQGFETYTKISSDEYNMSGEYKTDQMHSSKIKGILWKVAK